MLLLLLRSAAGGSDVTVTPGAGSLTLTGFAPTVTAVSSVTVTPGTGSLVITGYAPTVTVPTSVSVTPGTGRLTITGYAPTVTAGGQPSQDFRNVLDGSVGDYYEKRRKREKEDRKERERERIEALEAELREAEAPARPRKTLRRADVEPETVADPVSTPTAEQAPRPARATVKRKLLETPELMRAKAGAIEAATNAAAEAEARTRQLHRDAAIILLLAA